MILRVYGSFYVTKKVLGERKNVRNEKQQITELGLLQLENLPRIEFL